MSHHSIPPSGSNQEIFVATEKPQENETVNIETLQYIYHCLTKEEGAVSKNDVITHEDSRKTKGQNVYYAVYEAMINGLYGHEGLFKISAKLLEENAAMQNALTKQQGNLRYVDIPTDANAGKIAEVQKENQQIDTEKSRLQSMVTVYRQNASLAMAKINVDVQSENRLAAEINGYSEKLNNTAEAILQMNKRQ